MKVRVTQLARELNVTSYHVMNVLRSMGEEVRSFSSSIDEPVADRVRSQCAGRPTTSRVATRPTSRPNRNPTGADERHVATVRPQRSRREWYRPAVDGDLSDFVRFLLDNHTVMDRHSEPKTSPPSGYYRDEVESARKMAATWAAALFMMSMDEVLSWVRLDIGGSFLSNRLTVDDAIGLHGRGIDPTEIGWSYEDKDLGTLGQRLANGQLTVDEVALEIEARRGREK